MTLNEGGDEGVHLFLKTGRRKLRSTRYQAGRQNWYLLFLYKERDFYKNIEAEIFPKTTTNLKFGHTNFLRETYRLLVSAINVSSYAKAIQDADFWV